MTVTKEKKDRARCSAKAANLLWLRNIAFHGEIEEQAFSQNIFFFFLRKPNASVIMLFINILQNMSSSSSSAAPGSFASISPSLLNPLSH